MLPQKPYSNADHDTTDAYGNCAWGQTLRAAGSLFYASNVQLGGLGRNLKWRFQGDEKNMKSQIKMTQIVQSEPHIISRKEKNCYLLVNRKNGVVLAVDDIGMEIWNCTSKRIAVREIVGKLMKKYEVGLKDSARETVKFLEQLSTSGFLRISDRRTP